MSLPAVFLFKIPLIFETLPLSTDCLLSLIKACACGVSTTQLFGRSVASLHSNKDYRKNLKDKLVLNIFGMRPAYSFSKKTFQLISEIRSLSADCLPSLLDASVCGVSASQLFGRSVAHLFHPLRNTEKNYEE
ncbi:hypothetical protein KEH51_03840 [[Brevibacterium] frigoritolerans]|uniref:Uncharacterized protein n=1 Tax=Peribacillus frigoritolerans TaxID=450367 RepID=A0A941FPK5_9BACI|nr:hypothetical protein [Peribacillus frigoritolerans]